MLLRGDTEREGGGWLHTRVVILLRYQFFTFSTACLDRNQGPPGYMVGLKEELPNPMVR